MYAVAIYSSHRRVFNQKYSDYGMYHFLKKVFGYCSCMTITGLTSLFILESTFNMPVVLLALLTKYACSIANTSLPQWCQLGFAYSTCGSLQNTSTCSYYDVSGYIYGLYQIITPFQGHYFIQKRIKVFPRHPDHLLCVVSPVLSIPVSVSVPETLLQTCAV